MTSATSPDPSDPRVARSRAKVLDAATALLVESGPRAVTVDAVVERSGVAKSTVYRHWSSQQDLLVEVMRCNLPDVPAADPTLSFDQALRAIVGDLAAIFGDPEWRAVMLAMTSLQLQMPELAALLHEDQSEKFDILADVLDRGVHEGVLPDDVDPELVAHLLIGPMIFAVMSGKRPVDEVVAYALDRFLASYGAS